MLLWVLKCVWNYSNRYHFHYHHHHYPYYHYPVIRMTLSGETCASKDHCPFQLSCKMDRGSMCIIVTVSACGSKQQMIRLVKLVQVKNPRYHLFSGLTSLLVPASRWFSKEPHWSVLAMIVIILIPPACVTYVQYSAERYVLYLLFCHPGLITITDHRTWRRCVVGSLLYKLYKGDKNKFSWKPIHN